MNYYTTSEWPESVLPYEREYEGWIVQQIHDYFAKLKIESNSFVLPMTGNGGINENELGIDDLFKLDNRFYFGIQFKRPKKGDNNKFKFDIKYLQNRSMLLNKCFKSYYCVPTFLRRSVSQVALHHAVFLEVSKEEKDATKEIPSGPRWGEFLEKISEERHCKIQDLKSTINNQESNKNLKDCLQSIKSIPKRDDSDKNFPDEGYYIFAIKKSDKV